MHLLSNVSEVMPVRLTYRVPGPDRAADQMFTFGGISMQVLCKVSNSASDVLCPVCGQGFLVYWTRSALEKRAARREEIVKALGEQHASDPGEDALGPSAHPQTGFNLPEWQGEPRASAAALLGNAPAWAVA